MPPKRAGSSLAGSSRKRPRPIVTPSSSRVKIKTETGTSAGKASTSTVANKNEELKRRFIAVFEDPNNAGGVSNSVLKSKFTDAEYKSLVPVINELTKESRLVMSRLGSELFYNLVSNELASKLAGLDLSARMVYQVIEKAGNNGVWTKDVRSQTNIQQQALNKIFKALETRQLIKPVKSVSSKKVYMLYHLTPSKELTGGPWYTELEFDHEFINEMRKFLLTCVRRLNSGQGVSLAEIKEKIDQANVSKVKLSLEDVQQLMQTLAYDHLIEQNSTNSNGEALFVAARRVTPMCDFKWWDVVSPDFPYRKIRFEDGVVLAAHEPHHHTA